MCICHKTQKHLATDRYTNGHKRWPTIQDIWQDIEPNNEIELKLKNML